VSRVSTFQAEGRLIAQEWEIGWAAAQIESYTAQEHLSYFSVVQPGEEIIDTFF
jgi:hypothetical protein